MTSHDNPKQANESGRQAVIAAASLNKSFLGTVAVDGISFEVRKGEIFGFLGPNGAGKTTTMRMISCISPRTSGILRVLGMDPDLAPEQIKARLGIVPQESNLDPDYTVYGNLLSYSRYFGIPKNVTEKRACELLDFVQLQEKRDMSIEKLSGGMKRRLILARALINEPELIILDEPTIGLDPQARHLIWEKLAHLRDQGNTIVLTTHYLDEAARLCDRLVIMDNGRILVMGRPPDLVREHAGVEIVEVERTDEVMECLDGLHMSYEPAGDMLQIPTDSASGVAKVLLNRCRVTRIVTRMATLEDVFLKLTGRTMRE